MNQDLIRSIDGICREKNIDRDTFIADLENAIVSAVRKSYSETDEVVVKLDPLTGEISATVNGAALGIQALGRIAAQTAKQVIMQKTRERERTSIFEDFTERQGTIVTGTVVRAEGGNLLVNVGRTEGFLPRSEQIPGEMHQVGERIRVLILDVREQPNQIKIILSRSHPNFVARLFELEVPEVAERVIEIRALAREAGYRTKVAVSSIDTKVDAVGACVGVRGSRVKNIMEELGSEKIDIVRWNESSQILIQNALKPAEVQEIALCFELNKATVVVPDDKLSLAIGKRGQNVRLAARLTGWNIDILTPDEYNKNLELLERTVKSIEGVDDLLLDKLVAIGCVSVADVDAVESEPLVRDLEITQEIAEKIVEACGEEVIRLEEERETNAKLRASGLFKPDAEAAPAEDGAETGAETGAENAAGESGDAGAEVVAEGGGESAAAAPMTSAGEFVPERAPDVEGESPAADDAPRPVQGVGGGAA
ncbi:MAG: transcription termination/antitermination protein NusA [Planctomycetia bacterium]|nr:MAG: transcription termination/antitermination protein NusA [Planctomycetia bacterium]